MRVEHLREVADRFEGMLIDQFGVMHDGRALYPGTLGVLRELKARGIPVAVLTNSGKRAEANRQRLIAMGVPRDIFVDVVTSGEIAYQMITAASPEVLAASGLPTRLAGVRRAFIIGKDGDEYGFDGITSVDDPRDAEVLLILGSDAPRTSPDEYRARLAGLTLPAICCNPDRFMLTPNGLLPAPGAIAALYEEMGGTVTWIGKPHRAIYDHAAALIGHPRRVLCIGDSAEHDVAGGRGAGFATLLVTTGVSAGVDATTVEPAPDYWMESFTW